ncbi:MAG: argininosuccinate lyase [Candidatus Aenigmarchaeota archaeon]|nr:argininosuccinate lyase [Candidatus Aenigmarchaeota archaeon]
MKLWENGNGVGVHEKVEEFTAGEDIRLDQQLVEWDAIGSMAHASMLNKIGIITHSELMDLKKALVDVVNLQEKGKFRIELKDEDVHTKIENYLTETLGNVGKKIHTGRSRNDQVMVDLRLYTKEKLLKIEKNLLTLCKEMARFADLHKDVPMPGYTHFQKAMPSSVGLWAMAYVESFLDDLKMLKTAYSINDQNPLGSAAGYGVPLDLDRDLTTKLLGFGSLQNNVLYVQNSRGKIESIVLSALMQIMLDLGKLSNDVILYSTDEFGFFKIGERFRTGSSIMPKKRNPDILELVRGKVNIITSSLNQVIGTIKTLPSGYQRDLQETKEPLIKSLGVTNNSLEMVVLAVRDISVSRERLIQSFSSGIFATDEAFKLVSQGIPFRDAYKHVDYNFQKYKKESPEEIIKKRKYKGTTGDLGILNIKKKIDREMAGSKAREREFKNVITKLMKA